MRLRGRSAIRGEGVCIDIAKDGFKVAFEQSARLIEAGGQSSGQRFARNAIEIKIKRKPEYHGAKQGEFEFREKIFGVGTYLSYPVCDPTRMKITMGCRTAAELSSRVERAVRSPLAQGMVKNNLKCGMGNCRWALAW